MAAAAGGEGGGGGGGGRAGDRPKSGSKYWPSCAARLRGDETNLESDLHRARN